MTTLQTMAGDQPGDMDESTDHPPPGLLLPALSLARRELVRFLRQPNRIVGALATPLVFWLLIGGGMAGSFAGSRGENYLQFFFPGALVMILLFTAIFSTISVIEDRREGFLQSVLVAPISRQAVVLGKVLGGTALATGQGLIFLALAPLAGWRLSLTSLPIIVTLIVILSFALTALGFCIAWRMTSTQGFHAIMNLFLMPMWFLSGALFPPEGAWGPLRWIMHANPLTYGLMGLRRAMTGGASVAIPLGISAAFALGLFALASRVAARDSATDLA